jgi:hypothetical protein
VPDEVFRAIGERHGSIEGLFNAISGPARAATELYNAWPEGTFYLGI